MCEIRTKSNEPFGRGCGKRLFKIGKITKINFFLSKVETGPPLSKRAFLVKVPPTSPNLVILAPVGHPSVGEARGLWTLPFFPVFFSPVLLAPCPGRELPSAPVLSTVHEPVHRPRAGVEARAQESQDSEPSPRQPATVDSTAIHANVSRPRSPLSHSCTECRVATAVALAWYTSQSTGWQPVSRRAGILLTG